MCSKYLFHSRNEFLNDNELLPLNKRHFQCMPLPGGSFLDDNRCEICPGDEDDGCCYIDLATFAFSCNICETIDGVEECAEVECGLTDVGGYICDGCGDYSSGEACFNFECDGTGDW